MLVLLLAPYPFCVPQQLIVPETRDKPLFVRFAAAAQLIAIPGFAIDGAGMMRSRSSCLLRALEVGRR